MRIQLPDFEKFQSTYKKMQSILEADNVLLGTTSTAKFYIIFYRLGFGTRDLSHFHQKYDDLIEQKIIWTKNNGLKIIDSDVHNNALLAKLDFDEIWEFLFENSSNVMRL